jgi:hypothetical protein
MILRRTISGLVKKNLIYLILLFAFSSLPVFSQTGKVINIEEIPQKKVRKYIISRQIDKMHDFSLIHPSWKKETHESDFHVNEKIFYLRSKLSNVWESYRHANPVKAWNGQTFSLGLMILKCSNSVIYTNSSFFPAVDTGQVYFLNLKLMRGLYNLPVAFEVINIDNRQNIEEISYIDNNKSQGKQTIQFFDNGDGRTRIVHRSYFKSGSWFRDDFLYPYFHTRFIKKFHKNMRQFVNDTVPDVSKSGYVAEF